MNREVFKTMDVPQIIHYISMLPAGTLKDPIVTEIRNVKLVESDWTQLPDSPLTPEKKADWAEYRQVLRDVTEQPGFPNQVIWPSPPA